MADLLNRIVRGGLCQGCGACASALGPDRLSMKMDSSGYLRPARVSAPEAGDDVVLAKVCSGYGLDQEAAGRPYDATWGPILSLQTGYSKDPEVRYKGSSGGVISALAIHLVETGAVDFVLQTHASTEDPIGNETSASRDRSSIIASAGSRYSPSFPLVDIETHLAGERRFAFVGRPCDVAALRRMALRDPRIDVQVPIMLSFFCAGVPSRKGALAVLDALGVEHSDVKEFTYRGRGWPGLARAIRHDGTDASMDYNSSWGAILNRHLQFRCKICPDGTGEFADVVCADAWYGKDGYPDFTEVDGRSLVVGRTERGQALIAAASARGVLALNPLEAAELRGMQPYQYERKRAVLSRLAALLLKGRTVPRFNGLGLWGLTLRRSPLWLLRNMVGTYRRIPHGDLH
ncbi:Coenzyme F420 hydrogenase/dehydrogenase, beta subunit C-terminal domain [Brevundimonas sp. TWP2-3-2]|uniref:Coenzyme F420 hydrogenase/dehydrogenase, beta subunit C-terminal domain n=1 Tax=unclassified Brevundimonas TaxID=2622653 RepID=UPI003CEB78D2